MLLIGFPGFGSVADQLDGPAVTAQLGELLDLVTEPVLKHDGTVLRYDQAILLAVWNARPIRSRIMPAWHSRLRRPACERRLRP